MRKFVFKSSVFIAACVLFYILMLARTERYTRNCEYYPFSTMNDMLDGEINADLLVLGSSRAWVQYNTRILDSMLGLNSYNLGFNAQMIVPELQWYNIYREYNERPKYIVLDVFWNTLYGNYRVSVVDAYKPYLLHRTVRDKAWANNSIRLFPIPQPKDIDKIMYFVGNIKTHKGYCRHDWKWDGSELNKLESLDTVKFLTHENTKSLLESFIIQCNREGINLILIHSPFYIEGQQMVVGQEEGKTMFKEMAERHKVPFLDYTNDPICFDTTYFYNAMHLNGIGSDVFTAKLAHDLDSLRIIPKRR